MEDHYPHLLLLLMTQVTSSYLEANGKTIKKRFCILIKELWKSLIQCSKKFALFNQFHEVITWTLHRSSTRHSLKVGCGSQHSLKSGDSRRQAVILWGWPVAPLVGPVLTARHCGAQLAVRYQDEIFGPNVRSYTGAVGPGFLLVHDNIQPHIARVWRQLLEDRTLSGGSPIVQIWGEIPQDTSCHLIRSIPQHCMQAHGDHRNYWVPCWVAAMKSLAKWTWHCRQLLLNAEM